MSRRWRCADADFSTAGQTEFAEIFPEAGIALRAAGTRRPERIRHHAAAMGHLSLGLTWRVHLEDASVVLEHVEGAAALHGRTRRDSGRGRSRTT